MSSRDTSPFSRLSRPKSMTHIHVGGAFNSRLRQQTGFLSAIKKSSKLIAKNPTRFLEEYCVRREKLEAEYAETGSTGSGRKADPIRDTDCSELTSFLADLTVKPCHMQSIREPELSKKHEFMKKRSTILKIASSNLVSVDPDDMDGLRKDLDDEYDSSALEKVIESYIQQIRAKARDMGHILEWIQSDYKLSDLNLPYGLPKESLKIPTNPEYLQGGPSDKFLAGFIESSVDNFLLLDGEYHAKIEQITEQIQANNQNLVPPNECHHNHREAHEEGDDSEDEEIKSRESSAPTAQSRRSSYSASRLSVSGSNSSSSTPWTLSETSLLTFIINTLEEGDRMSPLSSTRSSLVQYELTARLFPEKSQESVINQKYCIKYKKMLEEKRVAVINDWRHDKAELVRRVNLAWDQLNRQYVQNLERHVVAAKQKDLCAHWSELLDRHRQERCERVKRLQIVEEPLRKRQQAELRHQSRREAERRTRIKQHIAQFRRQKEKAKLKQSIKQELEREMEDQVRRARDKINRVRVEARRTQLEERDRLRSEAEAVKQAEQLARDAKLESIKEPVDIDWREPWNSTVDTYASAVRRFETLQELHADPQSEEQKMVRFFRSAYSFPVEKVMKDRRVRLEMKLRDAGLMESSYARQVLEALQPKPKPHLSTQIKFEEDPVVNEARCR